MSDKILTAQRIVINLWHVNPIISNDHENTYCFFCNQEKQSFKEEIEHDHDCVWYQAKLKVESGDFNDQ